MDVGEVPFLEADVERELGVAPDDFAYPFGPSTPTVEAIVGEAGFAAGLTTDPFPSGAYHPDKRFPRMEVDGTSRFVSFVIGIWIGDLSWFRSLVGLARSDA